MVLEQFEYNNHIYTSSKSIYSHIKKKLKTIVPKNESNTYTANSKMFSYISLLYIEQHQLQMLYT